MRQERAEDLTAGEGSYIRTSALPHRATVRQMALHARLLRRGCVPGFLRICRKAPFPGLAGRRRRRQVCGSTPPSSGRAARRPPPRWKLPASSSLSQMEICRPRAATAQEGAIPPPLRRVGVRRAGASRARERHRSEKEGKREIIYINLLSSIGNPKYFMSKAPMVQLA